MELVARLKSLATDNWRRTLVVTTSVVLVLLIAVTLARLVWLVVEGPANAPGPGAATAITAPAAQRPQYTPDMARGWKLFGDAAAPTISAGSEAAPATNLSLQLLGVFSTGDARLAGAVISERGKDGELFRIGSAVPGGATLEKVEADKVLLRRRGQLETLRFDEAPRAEAGADAPKGLDMAAGFRSVKDRLSRPPADDGGSEAGDATSKAKKLLASLSDDLKSNPDGVLGELGLKSAAGGGYLVGEGTNSDAMRNLGLRPGDVVLSVNGKPIGNVQNDARLVDEVKASGEARVEIRRGSQTFTVNYPL